MKGRAKYNKAVVDSDVCQFRSKFCERYMPEVVKNRNHLDRLNLSQGTLTVGEYEYRFAQLARDAPTLVARENDLCRHFEEGLNYRIWSHLVPDDFNICEIFRNFHFIIFQNMGRIRSIPT